jgi:membrane protease subunit HflK
MAWNEPGGNKDPWGNKGNDGPPELDEIFKKLQDKLSGIFGGKGGGSSSSNSGGSGFIVGILIAVLVIAYVVMGAGVVNEQERAVVLRLGTYHSTKEPGFRWNPPLIDRVYVVNVTKVEEWSTKQQMLTQDLNIVDINISVQFVIDDARGYVLNVREPTKSLQEAANSALRHVAGSTVMHEVLTEGREQVAVEIGERLQTYLNSYGTGIQIETVNIEESNPPSEVQAAFDDVIKAREDEERYKNEAQTYANGIIPEARGLAQRMIEEATAYRERVIAESEGEAQRFEYLLAEYKKAPEVTRSRLYIDAVEEVMQNSSKVMVDVEGGNNMMYIPLDKITGQQSGSGAAPEIDIRGVTDGVIQELDRRGMINNSRSSSRSR